MGQDNSALGPLFVIRAADYRANLQFCCDHYRSVSEVCRRLKINRQQFNRYLAGTTTPSRHNHRRISDFFGLEESELFAAHDVFAASFRKHASSPAATDVGDRTAELLQAIAGPANQASNEYCGFYFKYFRSFLGDGRIKRELVRWAVEGGTIVSSVKQRYLGEHEEDKTSIRFLTFRGFVGTVGDRLLTIDAQRGGGGETSTMILYPKVRVLARLHGITIGVSHGPARSIAAARVVMEFLGKEIDIRSSLGRLGTFAADDPSIPPSIKRAVENGVGTDEALFLARV